MYIFSSQLPYFALTCQENKLMQSTYISCGQDRKDPKLKSDFWDALYPAGEKSHSESLTVSNSSTDSGDQFYCTL